MASIISQTSPTPQSEPLKGKLNHIKELLNDANHRLNQEAKVFTTKTSASSTTNRNGNQRHQQADELRRTLADISTIQSVLSCPIFDQIANVTDSLDKLSYHLNLRPSIGPSDIEFNDCGEIILAPPIESTSLNNLINSRLDDLTNSQPNGLDSFSVDVDQQHNHNFQQQFKPDYYSFPNVSTRENNRPVSTTGQNRQEPEQRDVIVHEKRVEQALSSNTNQQSEYDTERLVANSRDTNYIHNNRERKREPSKVQSVVAVFENASAVNNNGTILLADECDSGTSSFRSKSALHSPQSHDPLVSSALSSIDQELIEKLSPDMERIKVTLEKDSDGLGITIAGYTCEQEEICGIFIKSITPGSPADRSGKIRILDQIFAVNGQEILAYSNPEAVNVLRRQTGRVVTLELMRYSAESKYRKLQTLLDRAEPSSNLQKLEQQSFVSNSKVTSPTPIAAQRLGSKVIETKQGARNKIEIRSPLCQATYVNETRPLEFNGSYNANNMETIANRSKPDIDKFSCLVDSGWEKNVQIVSLRKVSNQSLGFTVKDYFNPSDSQRRVLLIDSITPNSIADRNGQLSIGDQLVFVDDTNLECSTPDEAAKAISRASGDVRLGILRHIRRE